LQKSEGFLDYVGIYHNLIKELGDHEFCDMRTGFLDIQENKIKWSSYDHGEFDGQGCIADFSRKNGFPSMPMYQGYDKKPPSFLPKLKYISRAMWPPMYEKTKWIKEYPANKKSKSKIAYAFLTKKETKDAVEKAKKHKTTIGRLLFWALNETVSKKYIKKRSKYYWLIPIDLRGSLNTPNDTVNHISRALVPCKHAINIQELNKRLMNELESNKYWGNYYLGKSFIDLLGIKGAKFLFRQTESTERFAGSFTILKEYPIKHPDNPYINDNLQLFFCGGNSKVMPVNCACITWNGRISITLRIHPSLCPEQSMIDDDLNTMLNLVKT
jgi:hypothetical protein